MATSKESSTKKVTKKSSSEDDAVKSSSKTSKKVVEKEPERERPAPRRTTAKPDVELLERSDIPLKPKSVAPIAQIKTERKGSDPLKEIKLPKITTKTSIPYNPGYVPMEKRVEEPKPVLPLVKYSDSDLNEFRYIITKKIEIAKKELAYLQGLITRKDEMGGDNVDSHYQTMDDGSMSMEREQLSQMASRQISYIDHLEKAIIRIENKTYGVCRITGKLIDKARLKSVPHATLSLEAKLGLAKSHGD